MAIRLSGIKMNGRRVQKGMNIVVVKMIQRQLEAVGITGYIEISHPKWSDRWLHPSVYAQKI